MGVIFEHDGNSVWEPSRRVGFLFVRQVRAIEEVLEIASGVGDIIDDECRIDAAALKQFVLELDRELGYGFNETMRSLLAGCLAVAAGLLVVCRPGEDLDLQPTGAALRDRGELLVSGRTWAPAIFVDLKRNR